MSRGRRSTLGNASDDTEDRGLAWYGQTNARRQSKLRCADLAWSNGHGDDRILRHCDNVRVARGGAIGIEAGATRTPSMANHNGRACGRNTRATNATQIGGFRGNACADTGDEARTAKDGCGITQAIWSTVAGRRQRRTARHPAG